MLNEYKNQKVTYNGKEVSLYEANQLQRRMERQIRADKKNIAGFNGILTSNTKDSKLLEDTKNKLLNKQALLKEHNSVLNDFIKQTGNRKDNTRLVVGKVSIQNKEEAKNVQYIGKLDKNKIGEYGKKIVSDEVILTDERVKHIKERHPRGL